jgi:hypothetical protein
VTWGRPEGLREASRETFGLAVIDVGFEAVFQTDVPTQLRQLDPVSKWALEFSSLHFLSL